MCNLCVYTLFMNYENHKQSLLLLSFLQNVSKKFGRQRNVQL